MKKKKKQKKKAQLFACDDGRALWKRERGRKKRVKGFCPKENPEAIWILQSSDVITCVLQIRFNCK